VTACRLRFLPASTFSAKVNSDVELRTHLVRAMSKEIHLQIARQELLTSKPAEQRLEKFAQEISELPEKYRRNPNNFLGVPLKQWEIAQLLSVTPEHLSRIRRKTARKMS
jgi:CRP-like cAMP-binding protein